MIRNLRAFLTADLLGRRFGNGVSTSDVDLLVDGSRLRIEAAAVAVLRDKHKPWEAIELARCIADLATGADGGDA